MDCLCIVNASLFSLFSLLLCFSVPDNALQVELMKCGLPTGVLSGEISMHRCVLDLDNLDGPPMVPGILPTSDQTDAGADADVTLDTPDADGPGEEGEPDPSGNAPLTRGGVGSKAPVSEETYLNVMSHESAGFESDDNEDDVSAADPDGRLHLVFVSPSCWYLKHVYCLVQ